eukprot:4973256-Amphidinium_carterae.1
MSEEQLQGAISRNTHVVYEVAQPPTVGPKIKPTEPGGRPSTRLLEPIYVQRFLIILRTLR